MKREDSKGQPVLLYQMLLVNASMMWRSTVCVCELFLFYLRGVSFARVIVSRNGNLYLFTNLHYFYSRQSGNYHILYGIDRRNHNELHCVHLKIPSEGVFVETFYCNVNTLTCNEFKTDKRQKTDKSISEIKELARILF